MFGPVAADRRRDEEGFRTLNARADFQKVPNPLGALRT